MVAHHFRIAYLHLVHIAHHHDAHGLVVDPLGATVYDLVLDWFVMPELIPGKLILVVSAHAHRHLHRWLEGE